MVEPLKFVRSINKSRKLDSIAAWRRQQLNDTSHELNELRAKTETKKVTQTGSPCFVRLPSCGWMYERHETRACLGIHIMLITYSPDYYYMVPKTPLQYSSEWMNNIALLKCYVMLRPFRFSKDICQSPQNAKSQSQPSLQHRAKNIYIYTDCRNSLIWFSFFFFS